MQKPFQPSRIKLGISYSPAWIVHAGLTRTSTFDKGALIRIHVCALVVLLGSMLSGCASPREAFRQAQSDNTVAAYERYIDAHPRGEYADQARNSIANLKLQQEKEKQEKLRLAALATIKTYMPNVTKEQQFFSDGWTIRDLIDGRVGILVATVNVDTLDLTLGYVESFHDLWWQSSTPTMNVKLVEDMSTYDPKVADAQLTDLMEARKNRGHYSVQYHFYKPGSGAGAATQLCTLRFKRGTLMSVQWLQ